MPVQNFTGKQRMQIDWMMVKNSILRAASGEMNIIFKKDSEGKTIGIKVDMDLDFGCPVPMEFLDDEKAAINEAKKLKDVQPNL
jgi:aromatic ring-opening dioxygenase LigB subunit